MSLQFDSSWNISAILGAVVSGIQSMVAGGRSDAPIQGQDERMGNDDRYQRNCTNSAAGARESSHSLHRDDGNNFER